MRPSRPGHIAIAAMIDMLITGATVPDMADESGLTEASVRSYVRALRKRRAIHVAAWEHDTYGRQSLAAYRLGRKPDAVRVPPRNRAEIARHYRARRKDARLLGVHA